MISFSGLASGLDTGTKGAECGFVTYPTTLPSGLSDGAAIPGEQWLLLAYGRDGGDIRTAYPGSARPDSRRITSSARRVSSRSSCASAISSSFFTMDGCGC